MQMDPVATALLGTDLSGAMDALASLIVWCWGDADDSDQAALASDYGDDRHYTSGGNPLHRADLARLVSAQGQLCAAAELHVLRHIAASGGVEARISLADDAHHWLCMLGHLYARRAAPAIEVAMARAVV